MLDLDDPRWSDLSHAYGRATDAPDFLRVLEDPDKAHDEAFFALWSRLCHQGDVYDASYAAVPHLIRVGMAAKPPGRSDYLVLPSSIEIARVRGDGPEIPGFLTASYASAMASLLVLADTHDDAGGDESMKRAVMAARAVGRGDIDTAESILDEDDV